MSILILLERLKPIKTDRKSIVDLDSLNITSVAPLGWPFMPKQDPRSVKKKKKIKNVTRTGGGRAKPPRMGAPTVRVTFFIFPLFFITNKRSCTVQYCTVQKSQ